MDANETDSTNDSENTTRRRKPTDSPSRKPQPLEPDYTREQFEQVKRIKNCKDYYEVLKVTKEATDTEIKKSYKKLALVLHPGMNYFFYFLGAKGESDQEKFEHKISI